MFCRVGSPAWTDTLRLPEWLTRALPQAAFSKSGWGLLAAWQRNLKKRKKSRDDSRLSRLDSPRHVLIGGT
jgi:hypothetical protein